MGTGSKGKSKYYRSIGQNVLIAASTYHYEHGGFGNQSTHGNAATRTIAAKDNVAAAIDFYRKIANGGIEQRVNDNLLITRMADGTVVTMRYVSHSDGTPVVDINIKTSSHTGGVKNQKIHFIVGGDAK